MLTGHRRNVIFAWGLTMTALSSFAQTDRFDGRLENGGIPLRLSVPRIPPVTPSNWTDVQRGILESRVTDSGTLPHVYGTLGNHPVLYEKWLGFAAYILRSSTLPAREREMLICRIAWLTNGEYEWSAHVRLGKAAGLTANEILRLAEGPEAEGWSPVDGAIVRAVDELHADAFITDVTWELLTAHFNTQQMMDLVLTVGAYNMLAQALNSFGAQLQDDMDGFPPRQSITGRPDGRKGRVSNQGGIPLRLGTPRVPPLAATGWTEEQAALLEPIKRQRGSVPNIYLTMANHPEMFTPRLNFGRHLQRESTLPPREREIAINRIAWLTSAEYEWAAHTAIGLQNGLTEEEITRIAAGPAHLGWNEFDRALLRAVDGLHETAFIGEETWQILAARFDTLQMMDFVMTVGGYHMLAMALNSFGVQLQDGATGFPK